MLRGVSAEDVLLLMPHREQARSIWFFFLKQFG
jgi:hypothetical protein